MQKIAFSTRSEDLPANESAGERAAQITRQLRELDPHRPSEVKQTTAVALPRVQRAIDAPVDPRQAASSFRRRLMAARTDHDG